MSLPIARVARVAPAFLLALAFDVSAETPQNPSLGQVTVTAERLSPTAPGEAAARAEVARVPGGANVVGSDEYSDGRVATLADVFAFTPGVFVQSRFGSEEARLSIRGSGLQRTFHMRGINLLQDGVPLTLADGGGDFQAVEPLVLEYTQVMRGANALQHGGTTLGGAINFISPSGYDGGGIRSRLEGGSYGYWRALATLGDASAPSRRGDAGSADYFLAASASEQDGFRDWSAQENRRVFGNAGWRVTDNLDTRFFVAAVSSDSQLPGSLTRAQLESDPEQANAGNRAGRQKRDFDLYRLANRTVLELGEGELELVAGYSYKDLWHPIFQVLKQQSDDYNLGARYVGSAPLASFANRIVIGVAPSWNRVKDDRFVNLAGSAGSRTAESRQRSSNVSVYAQDEFDVTGELTLVAGAQWTQSERRYEDLFLTNGDQSLDATYSRVSPKLGFLWRPKPTWAVFGNVSDSFEPPSFGELSGGPGVDLLDDQHARTVELGTRGSVARVQWDVVAYSADVRDELLGLNNATGQPLGTVNAPRTVHRGLELGAQIALTDTLSWRSAYLYSDFRFDDHPVYADNTLPGIPRHFYRGELTLTPRESWFVTLTSEWSPDRVAVDMANSLFADSYATWGAKLGRTVEDGFSFFIEGRNLSDRTYAASTGVIPDARGLDAAQFLPGDGRSVYAGVSWRTR